MSVVTHACPKKSPKKHKSEKHLIPPKALQIKCDKTFEEGTELFAHVEEKHCSCTLDSVCDECLNYWVRTLRLQEERGIKKFQNITESSCLIWPELKHQDKFNDVTLASKGRQLLKAHTVILAASSNIVKLVEFFETH